MLKIYQSDIQGTLLGRRNKTTNAEREIAVVSSMLRVELRLLWSVFLVGQLLHHPVGCLLRNVFRLQGLRSRGLCPPKRIG